MDSERRVIDELKKSLDVLNGNIEESKNNVISVYNQHCSLLKQKQNMLYKNQSLFNRLSEIENGKRLKMTQLNDCKSLLENCSSFIKTINARESNLLSKWKKFESNWQQWRSKELIIWFKYILYQTIAIQNEMNKLNATSNGYDDDDSKDSNGSPTKGGATTNVNLFSSMKTIKLDEIDFVKIEKKVRGLNFIGKSLIQWDILQLKKIGFSSLHVQLRLNEAINILTHRDRGMNTDYDSYGSKFGNNTANKSKHDRNDSDANVCRICLTNKINTVITSCGHACMCKECLSEYSQSQGCPMCRRPIGNVIDLFI